MGASIGVSSVPPIIIPVGGLNRKTEQVTPARQKVIPSLPSQGGEVNLSVNDFIARIYNANPGIFIGDRHGEYNCSEFVSSLIPSLKAQGVTVLFMEMFPSDKQPLLDRYFKVGDNEQQLLAHLQRYWEKTPLAPEKYLQIIRTAKANGIRVVGIDCEHTGQNRLETSNPHWVGVIKNNLKSTTTKYVIFGGYAHAGNYPYNKGVDYRLGIPSVELSTGEELKILLGDSKGNDFQITLPNHPEQPPDY